MPKKSHQSVKRFINVRALVSALMLVVDYIVPVNGNDGTVFATWVQWINAHCNHVMREEAMRWANRQRLFELGELKEGERVAVFPPNWVKALPYTRTNDGTANATGALINPDGPVITKRKQCVQMPRAWYEKEVIRAVNELPSLAKAALRGAWRILEGHSPELNDARIELLGLAFDLANGVAGVQIDSLSKYAYRALDERLAPMPVKRDDSVFATPDALTRTQKDIANECGLLCGHLVAKNRKYGDSALDPVHIFSKEPAHMQLRQQIDHKLARIQRGDASVEDEDTLLDLQGYLLLYRIALARWNAGEGNKVKP